MPGPVEESTRPHWHAALSHALLGRVPDLLAEPGEFDLDTFLRDLDQRWPGGLPAVRAEIARQRSSTRWPHSVPKELRRGLGPAQFAAAVAGVNRALGADVVATRRPVERGLDAEERRLEAEVPPHHIG